jgi:hypothetical protein
MLSVSIDGGEPVPGVLTLDPELISVRSRSATVPDLAWEMVDRAGHFHAFDGDGNLPTLEPRPRRVACDGSCGGSCRGEGFVATDWFCLVCGVLVVPGRVLATGTKFIAGPVRWRVEVEASVVRGRQVSVVASEAGVVWFGVGVAGASSAESGRAG